LSRFSERSLKSLPGKGFKDFELITQQLYYWSSEAGALQVVAGCDCGWG